jgi:hypothetical protein
MNIFLEFILYFTILNSIKRLKGKEVAFVRFFYIFKVKEQLRLTLQREEEKVIIYGKAAEVEGIICRIMSRLLYTWILLSKFASRS